MAPVIRNSALVSDACGRFFSAGKCERWCNLCATT
jgi:hypothetical protein